MELPSGFVPRLFCTNLINIYIVSKNLGLFCLAIAKVDDNVLLKYFALNVSSTWAYIEMSVNEVQNSSASSEFCKAVKNRSICKKNPHTIKITQVQIMGYDSVNNNEASIRNSNQCR